MENRYYEGCGLESPIRCIYLEEFHSVTGRKIACQFPEDYISKEMFDAINTFVIPKPQMQRCNMTINALGHKILGYPIRIDSPRYPRNVYLFNLCFVCDSWSRTVQYEPVVKKLGEYLTTLEEETGFVSSGSSKLPTMLAHLLYDLNTHRQATITEGDTVIHLKVQEIREDPKPVHDHDVPVVVASLGLPKLSTPQHTMIPKGAEEQTQEHKEVDLEYKDLGQVNMENSWDLTTKKLLPYINGYNHVSKIAADTNVEKTLVKSCIQNLVYYGVVTVIPVLKFSNMYRATPKFHKLIDDIELQNACLSYITVDPKQKPSIAEVVEVLSDLEQGTTLRTVCERYASTRSAKFDTRKLIIFAQMYGLIRCLKRYPVYLRDHYRPTGTWTNRPETKGLRKLFTGKRCTDEICCLASIGLPALEQIIEEDPSVGVIWR